MLVTGKQIDCQFCGWHGAEQFLWEHLRKHIPMHRLDRSRYLAVSPNGANGHVNGTGTG
ncbi:MAG: hypothetical protein WD533_06580 [Dehalococcoidia bacterium]